jgi:hypothetical protein
MKSSLIVGIARVPPGWHIEIDNETNEMPTISGIAIEQAADLDEREFAAGFILVADVAKHLPRSGPKGKISVEGNFEWSDGDTKRILPVSDANVTLTPARSCGLIR